MSSIYVEGISSPRKIDFSKVKEKHYLENVTSFRVQKLTRVFGENLVLSERRKELRGQKHSTGHIKK